MKRCLILIIFLISGLCVCYGKTYTTQDELQKIDEETKKCINMNFMTDYGMMQCSIEGMRKYNIEIERTIKAAEKMLSKAQYEQLLKTQKLWEDFMQQDKALYSVTFEKNCPPYLPCLTAQGTRYENVKKRAVDLSGFCGLLELFAKDGVLDDELNFVEFSYQDNYYLKTQTLFSSSHTPSF